MNTRRSCEGRLGEQLCGDLWESGAAGWDVDAVSSVD